MKASEITANYMEDAAKGIDSFAQQAGSDNYFEESHSKWGYTPDQLTAYEQGLRDAAVFIRSRINDIKTYVDFDLQFGEYESGKIDYKEFFRRIHSTNSPGAEPEARH